MTLPTSPNDDVSPELDEPVIVAPLPVDEPRQVRGHTAFAWCVIVAVSSLVIVLTQLRPRLEKGAAAAADPKVQESSTMGDILATVAEVQAKIIVAVSELTRADQTGQAEVNRREMRRQIESMNQGPPSARLRFIVLAGELGDPEDALKELANLRLELAKSDRTLDPSDDQVDILLERIYESYKRDPKQLPQLTEPETGYLRKRLGWFADLALAPYGGPNPQLRKEVVRSAQKTMGIAAVAGLTGLAIFCVGLVILVTLLILAATGKLTSKIVPSQIHPGLYAETFAWWMILYLGLNLVLGLLVSRLDFELGRWSVPLVAQALSLSALLWPVVRGVRFGDVRRDVGISLPSHAWLEPLRGAATYAMSLPILAVGVMLTMMLMAIQSIFTGAGDPFSAPNVPAHPIVETVRDNNPWTFWQILFLAAVGAPIVEEIMFRGVLYRSLRDSTRYLRVGGSIVASMAVSGFLFAAIHPQGWVAIPALGGLATGFAIAREWRGTIWPSVIAHGINNGLVTVLLFTVFGA